MGAPRHRGIYRTQIDRVELTPLRSLADIHDNPEIFSYPE